MSPFLIDWYLVSPMVRTRGTIVLSPLLEWIAAASVLS